MLFALERPALLLALAGCMSRGAPSNDAASAAPLAPATATPPSATASPTPAPATSPATSPAPTPDRSASATVIASGATNTPPAPQTEKDCQACNGDWGRHGLFPKESCNCRTTDAGKRCRDGTECQGQCVAGETPEFEVTQKGPPALGYMLGHCSELRNVFGCKRFVRDGAASGPPRDISKLPPKLCVD